MALAFSRLQQRVNARVALTLANARATIAGGSPIDGIFEREAGDALTYVSGSKPTFQCPVTGSASEGDGIVITDDSGAVLLHGEISRVEDDGTGWWTLSLQETS